MSRFWTFWWRCAQRAFWGNASFANNWQWLTGAPIFFGLASFAAHKWTTDVRMFGNPIANAVATAVAGFLITWSVAFIVRLVSVPADLYYEEKTRAETLAQRIQGEGLQREQTEVTRLQTEELVRQRQQRERELDPALRAFREQQFQTMNAGGSRDEESLGIQIWWIAVKSAWGRWQCAQHGFEPKTEPDRMLLHLTASYVLDLLVSGKIIVRAQKEDDGLYEEVSPDFWLTKFLRILPDVFRVEICWRPDRSDTRSIGYRYPRCEWSRIRVIFPEHDDEIDAQTERLLSQKVAHPIEN